MQLMNIQYTNFDFNNRINELTRQPDWEGVSLKPLLVDLIQALDPIESLELETFKTGTVPESTWDVVRGPGLYALIQHWSNPFFPKIIWIGEAEHVKGRVTEHLRSRGSGLRLGRLDFDCVRSVFIENDEVRRLLERELIRYFKENPESCHQDSILNKNIG
jgi:hypothetical protein